MAEPTPQDLERARDWLADEFGDEPPLIYDADPATSLAALLAKVRQEAAFPAWDAEREHRWHLEAEARCARYREALEAWRGQVSHHDCGACDALHAALSQPAAPLPVGDAVSSVSSPVMAAFPSVPTYAAIEEFMRHHGYVRAHFASKGGGNTYNIELDTAERPEAGKETT